MLFHRILAAYDGSEPSRKALDTAIAMAQNEPFARLFVLHVAQMPQIVVGEAFIAAPAAAQQHYDEAADEIVRDAKQRTSALQNVTSVVKQAGAPGLTILEYAKEHECDLIVIGSRGLGGFRELILGSVSHYVVQHASMPVLVVK